MFFDKSREQKETNCRMMIIVTKIQTVHTHTPKLRRAHTEITLYRSTIKLE